MAHAEYTVRLDAFEGPLDLLLFLIRRAEVEITDIPIASITDQYVKYIEDLGAAPGNAGPPEALDIERAGEFLVMAATLMEIKSRMLAPPPEPLSEGGPDTGPDPRRHAIDPRAELVQQLLEYKRFRDASHTLDDLRHQWHSRFPGGHALPERTPARPFEPPITDPSPLSGQPAAPVEMDDLTLVDLVEAFAAIIESVDFSRVGEHHVLMDDTPVELHAEDILDRLKHALDAGPTHSLAPGELGFADIFSGRSRAEMIGLFLALLELVKQQRISIRQERDDASGNRIVLRLAEAEPAPATPAVPTP